MYVEEGGISFLHGVLVPDCQKTIQTPTLLLLILFKYLFHNKAADKFKGPELLPI